MVSHLASIQQYLAIYEIKMNGNIQKTQRNHNTKVGVAPKSGALTLLVRRMLQGYNGV